MNGALNLNQLKPREQTAMMDLTTGRTPMIPRAQGTNIIDALRAQLGDDVVNELIQRMLVERAPRFAMERMGGEMDRGDYLSALKEGGNAVSGVFQNMLR